VNARAGLVCSALFLALAAGCDDGDKASSTEPAAGLPPVPRTLADGSAPAELPAALRRFDGRPVLRAKRLAARSVSVRTWCPAARARARFSTAWISTEGLTVSYAVGRSAPFACDGVLVNRRWVLCGGSSAHFRDPARVEQSGGGLNLCWNPNKRPRYRAFMWVAAPVQAAWALVDHHSYWVSYRTNRTRLLRISGLRGIERSRFRVKLAYLDERGRTLRERQATGYVAG
jgi:hypothetical protein